MEIFTRDTDTVLTGKVTAINSGTSKNGNNFTTITLEGQQYDPVMELMMDTKEDIVFTDRDTAYGPQTAATKAQSMKIQEGSHIAVKGTKAIADDGKVSYYGSKAVYPSSVLEFRDSEKKGPGVWVLFGYVNPSEANNTVSVPVRCWDRTKSENYTAWAVLKQDDAGVSAETMAELSELNAAGKHKLVAFVVDRASYKEEIDADGRTSGITGKFMSYNVVA